MIKQLLLAVFMPLLPKKVLSHWVGKLALWHGPVWLTRFSVRTFARVYRLNMDEAEFPLEHYPTLAALFTRRLRPEVRPVGHGLVHPVDGVLTQAGSLRDGTLIQSKGKTYELQGLLRDADLAQQFLGGSYWTYYLCPTDYHRVHTPVAGEVIEAYHIPGQLWPVNAWSVATIRNLFAINERVVVVINTSRGKVAVILVGATNVGQIELCFDGSLRTNRQGEGRSHGLWSRHYKPPVSLQKGDELGVFHMGSSVVVLYAPTFGSTASHTRTPKAVRMGESVEPLALVR